MNLLINVNKKIMKYLEKRHNFDIHIKNNNGKNLRVNRLNSELKALVNNFLDELSKEKMPKT